MAFDLLNIQPHKVSRDLSGYITFIYGAYKTGKTTLATQMMVRSYWLLSKDITHYQMCAHSPLQLGEKCVRFIES